MLDVLNNIDTVNYVVQDCMEKVFKKGLEYRMNYYVGEQYKMDVRKGPVFTIRSNNMQTLCSVHYEKNSITLRYSHKFMITYNTKTGLAKTNLFDEVFNLKDMESTFFVQNTIGFGIPLTIDFNYDTMIETFNLCRSVYEFLSTMETKG